MMTKLYALICAAVLPLALGAQTPDEVEFFEKDIRPLLAAKCQVCHNSRLKTAELDLSTAEGFVRGGASGPLVSKQDPSRSKILRVIRYEESMKMPPMGKLSNEEIGLIERWIGGGATWPGAEAVTIIETADKQPRFSEEQKTFWAFQPLADPEPPAVKDTAWVESEIDRFVLAKLEEANLQPAAPASKVTLLRRVTFDLTGLPPSPQEIEAFLADQSPDAFAQVVDRLQSSTRYGERWGRHWLDVARYADSTGNDEDHRYPYAWRYRDYVVAAFNNDTPFNQFIQEQIAGDLLPADDGSEINRPGIVATGFLALGPKAIAQQDKTKMLYDVYDEQVDVVTKGVLGLTLACARCHDHKFDPLLTRDYYSMAGIFASTKSFADPSTHVSKLLFTPLVADEEWKRYEADQEEIRKRQFELDNLAEIEVEQYVKPLAPLVKDYMQAARRIYDDGKDLQATANLTGLDAALLAKWVKYLQPSVETRAHLTAWDEAAPEQRAAAAEQFGRSFNETLDQWYGNLAKWRKEADQPAEEITMGAPAKPRFEPGENRFFHEVLIAKGGPLAFHGEELDAILSDGTKARIAELENEIKGLKQTAMKEPARACAVQEGEPVAQRVFIRGDYNSKGEPAPKVFPAILGGFDQQENPSGGSGRLELARWLTEDDHPLTPRVIVNRMWHWHFGEGIVRTPSNFGKMGERPTHPELLDWLTRRFIEDGWSIKKLNRRILLSAAYRMSSEFGEAKAMADPENRLLSRFNRRRLEVEEIRDGLLAIDGSIDLTVGGTLQDGFGTDGENSNGRLSVNPDEQVRRTIYLPLRRANLPALLNLFDFGDAVTPLGRRSVTNVAPQALFMMNSKFVADRAANLARQLLARDDPAERVRGAYLHILNRAPTAQEQDEALTYLAEVERKFSETDRAELWAGLCRILMSSNELIYVD